MTRRTRLTIMVVIDFRYRSLKSKTDLASKLGVAPKLLDYVNLSTDTICTACDVFPAALSNRSQCVGCRQDWVPIASRGNRRGHGSTMGGGPRYVARRELSARRMDQEKEDTAYAAIPPLTLGGDAIRCLSAARSVGVPITSPAVTHPRRLRIGGGTRCRGRTPSVGRWASGP